MTETDPKQQLNSEMEAQAPDQAEPKQKDDGYNNYMLEGMSIGLCLGVAFGLLVFDNLPIGIGCGMCLGLAVGSGIKKKKKE